MEGDKIMLPYGPFRELRGDDFKQHDFSEGTLVGKLHDSGYRGVNPNESVPGRFAKINQVSDITSSFSPQADTRRRSRTTASVPPRNCLRRAIHVRRTVRARTSTRAARRTCSTSNCTVLTCTHSRLSTMLWLRSVAIASGSIWAANCPCT